MKISTKAADFIFIEHNKNMYFNYHAKVRRLIQNGEAVCYEILDVYHNISPCLLIYFKNNPPMPIRQRWFDYYILYLSSFGVFPKDKK